MQPEKLAERYRGSIANKYDRSRIRSEKWQREQEILSSLIGRLPRQASIVDVPTGTGRLIELYAQVGLLPTCVDISNEMLDQARAKAAEHGVDATCRVGDIRKLDFAAETFDAAICIRLLNWLDIGTVRQALSELQRVSRKWLIVGIRTWVPRSENGSLVQGLGRTIGRFRKRFRSPGLTWHEPTEIAKLFDALSLSVIDKQYVERGKAGTDYVIYFLEKTRKD